MTLQEEIKSFEKEVYNADTLYPARVVEIMATLSALRGSVAEEGVKREMEFNKELLKDQVEQGSKAKGETVAKTSQEYESWIRIKVLIDSIDKMISTLKYFSRERERDARDSRLQEG